MRGSETLNFFVVLYKQH